MKYKLNIAIICFLVLLILPGPAVLADDVTSGQGTQISLDIVWQGDQTQDRPEWIEVELYRSVNGKDETVETRKISADQLKKGTDNTWTVLFSGLSGQSWEYAFKVDGASDITDLYAYSFAETGAGTDTRVFTYTHGTGSTDMTVTINWEDNNNQGNTRPDQYEISLFSPSDTSGTPERTVTLSAQNAVSGNSNQWTATITGLKEDPSSYAVSPTSQPDNYRSTVVRGTNQNQYNMTNTLVITATAGDSTQQNAEAAVTSAVNSLSYIPALDSGVLRSSWLNVLLLALLGGICWLSIQRHRMMVRRAKQRKKRR